MKLSTDADEQQITAISTHSNYIIIAGNQSLQLYDATHRICSTNL